MDDYVLPNRYQLPNVEGYTSYGGASLPSDGYIEDTYIEGAVPITGTRDLNLIDVFDLGDTIDIQHVMGDETFWNRLVIDPEFSDRRVYPVNEQCILYITPFQSVFSLTDALTS
jgi:hypothetical protein